MHAQLQRRVQRSRGEHLHPHGGAMNEPGGGERVRVDHGVFVEPRQLADVDLDVFAPPAVVESPQLGEPLGQRHLSAFEAGREADARARSLAFLPAPGGLALPGRDTAADALLGGPAPPRRGKLVQLHDSTPASSFMPSAESAGLPSTLTRWRTLRTIPTTAGLAWCSTVWCSRRKPRAVSVARWSRA